jgi:hypothetical protein
MTNPQSPELRRSEKGATTQQGQTEQLGGREGPGEGGQPVAPTPVTNQPEDERRSGEGSTTYDEGSR